MDVEQLRGDAEWIQHYGTLSYELRAAAALLRILDAFDAMQEHNWMIHRNNTETATGEVVECWDIVASDGTCLAELGDPISSLLAAAQTLEDKSDA